MMQFTNTPTSLTLTPNIQLVYPARDTILEAFSFPISPKPTMKLLFTPRPPPPPPRSRKRGRAVADIDGEHSCLHKKKRRLRLFLITSRLSPQFSHPATNIVDRGSSKIAVWAKQKALGRNLLRKAAILNRIRRRAIAAKEATHGIGHLLIKQEQEQKQLELAKLAFVYGRHDTHARPELPNETMFPPTRAVKPGDHSELTEPSPPASTSLTRTPPSSPPFKPRADDTASVYRSPNDAYSYSPPRAQIPRRTYLPLPPSPLGLSNYDAFDLEDDIPDPYAHLDDDEDQDDEMPCSPFSPSATTPASQFTTLSTIATSTTDAPTPPPQLVYSDYDILDPGEAVVGDYDQVDEGADAVWPSSFAAAARDSAPPNSVGSTSPDFPALFATSTENRISMSPNFSAVATMATIDDGVSQSPNFTILSVAGNESKIKSGTSNRRSDSFTGADGDLEQEKQRQKNFMFMRFGS